jgi:spore coat protein CotH
MILGCEDDGRRADKPASNDDFFSSPRVLELALDLAPSELDALKNNKDSHAYVHCAVREGDRSYADVGIHCRGNPEQEFASGKPDFTVSFDKFVSGQKFHGQRRLTLQGSREDPSYLAAPLSFEMFRKAGVPAPRFNFARVKLNARDLGLYVVIEGVDRGFLRQHFRQSNGDLYDEGEDTDVTSKLEKDRGADRDDQSDIDALAAAALQTDPDLRWKELQQRLDMNRFLAFMALEVLLWQEDSYSLHARKFRIYNDPETGRLVFFPKGVERVLEQTDGPILPKCKGVVAKAVLTTPEGQKQYRQTVARLLDTVFNPARIQARSQQLAAAIRPAAFGDDAGAAKAFDTAVAQFCDTVSRRASFAGEQLKGPQAN